MRAGPRKATPEMPTYEYACEGCGHRFDHFQSMSSRKLRKCPECEQRKLIRLVGAGAGLIFKGSGFYETDYKRSSSPAPSGDSDSSSKSSAKSDSGSGSDDSGSASGGSDE